MTLTPASRWIRFLRSYGPIPTNDNMYDETIQRALRRNRIEPITLPALYLDDLIANLGSNSPQSEILTGTAGDGKTYHCRKVWLALGGSEEQWNKGDKIQKLTIGPRTLLIVKDLSELRADESAKFLATMAEDVVQADSARVYLIAANHGQLLEKLKAAPQTSAMADLVHAAEELLVTGTSQYGHVRISLRDLSRATAARMISQVIDAIVQHPAWGECEACPIADGGGVCPILENRRRLLGEADDGLFRRRLTALVELSEQNDAHFPVRQQLALVTNILLGHPDAPDALMSCAGISRAASDDALVQASAYRNVFGENLRPRRMEKSDLFRKLNAFGIGGETSNSIDGLLVYGADDPSLQASYRDLLLSDSIYGAAESYRRAQRAYLEAYEEDSRSVFLSMLRAQRQRLFFTLSQDREAEFDLWELTVFRFGGLYLEVMEALRRGSGPPRGVMPLLVRGLNRVFTGMLVQNQDELVLATSGSHSQAKTSPLLDELISVPRQGGEEVSLALTDNDGVALIVRLWRGDESGVLRFPLTPTRFEFLGRVAEGALPSSFSLECYEDLLAFKARILSATAQRRARDDDGAMSAEDLVLRFIEIGGDGRAVTRRITIGM